MGQICYKYFNNKRYYYILNENYDIKILGVYNVNDKKGVEYKMLTEKEEILVADMKYLKIPMETIEAVMDSFQTEEQRQIMLNSIKRRFNEKGTVTEQELLKMMIMITVRRKILKRCKYSDYLELKRENKHLKEVQSIDVLYAVNAKKEPAGSVKSRRFRHLLLVLQLVYPICLIMSILYCFKVYLTNIIIRNSFEK